MLRDDLDRVRREPTPAFVALLVGVVLGTGFAWAVDIVTEDTAAVAENAVTTTVPEDEAPVTAEDPTAEEASPSQAPDSEAVMGGALSKAVKDAQAQGAEVEAAIVLDGWEQPIVRRAPEGPEARPLRAWSTHKVFTAAALLRQADGTLTQPIREAMRAALVNSENCPARAMVIDLQRRLGGQPSQATEAVRSTLDIAGASATLATEGKPSDDARCPPKLVQYGLSGDASAVQFGTSTWTVADGARFMLALGQGRLEAPTLLDTLRLPKQASTELTDPGQYTPDPAWGAGKTLSQWDPAYKAGWGGASTGDYVASQIVYLEVGGRRVGLAIAVHPSSPPADDDPGKTSAVPAMEAAMGTVARALERLEG